MPAQIITKDGKQYLILGDRALEIARFEERDGAMVPVIATTTEERPNAAGGQDIVVHVPFLHVVGETNAT